MSRGAPLVIELLGQPGSGKSTIVRASAEGLDLTTRAGLATAWRQLPLLAKSGAFARTMGDGACLIAAIRLVASARLFDRNSLARLLRLLVKGHWLRAQRMPLLLEEGHLQDLWSILYSAGRTNVDPTLLAPLIRCLYRGVDARIMLLELDTDQAVDRIRARRDGRSRFDRLAEYQLRTQWAATSQLPHQLADAARLAGLAVDRLDASLPVEVNARILRAATGRLD